LLQTQKRLLRPKKKNKKKKEKNNFSRKQLQNVRVIQRNLVYVVGLTLNVAKEKFLRTNFGIYGKISKIVINKSNLSSSKTIDTSRTPTVSAYVTFLKKTEAADSIAAIDGTWLDTKLLRASFGTTKYCSYFLRGIQCVNPECMYLHEYGHDEYTFNKEEIILQNGLPVPQDKDKLLELYPQKENQIKHTWIYSEEDYEFIQTEEGEYYDENEEYYDENEEYYEEDEEEKEKSKEKYVEEIKEVKVISSLDSKEKLVDKKLTSIINNDKKKIHLCLQQPFGEKQKQKVIQLKQRIKRIKKIKKRRRKHH